MQLLILWISMWQMITLNIHLFYSLKVRLRRVLKRLILIFFEYVLSDNVKKYLVKGFSICRPLRQHNYADYVAHFELFYRDIHDLEILFNENLDFVKTRTKEPTLFSFRQYNKNPQENFLIEEHTALTISCKNKDITIQKSEKGNSVVIVKKNS